MKCDRFVRVHSNRNCLKLFSIREIIKLYALWSLFYRMQDDRGRNGLLGHAQQNRVQSDVLGVGMCLTTFTPYVLFQSRVSRRYKLQRLNVFQLGGHNSINILLIFCNNVEIDSFFFLLRFIETNGFERSVRPFEFKPIPYIRCVCENYSVKLVREARAIFQTNSSTFMFSSIRRTCSFKQ